MKVFSCFFLCGALHYITNVNSTTNLNPVMGGRVEQFIYLFFLNSEVCIIYPRFQSFIWLGGGIIFLEVVLKYMVGSLSAHNFLMWC